MKRLLLISTFLISAPVFADGFDHRKSQTASEVKTENENPPVRIPGEVHKTSDGKKVKVWTTEGPVPVTDLNDAKEPSIPVVVEADKKRRSPDKY